MEGSGVAEGHLPEEYLMEVYSYAPVVYFLVLYAGFRVFNVGSSFEAALKRGIGVRASVVVLVVVFELGGVALAEIDDFDVINLTFFTFFPEGILDEDVGRLEIPVDNSRLVQMNDSFNKLLGDVNFILHFQRISIKIDILLQRMLVLIHQNILHIFYVVLAVILNQMFFVFD